MKKVGVFLAGLGHVGRSFVDLVYEKAGPLRTRYGLEVEVIAAAKSDGGFHTGQPLEPDQFLRRDTVWTDGNPAWKPAMKVTDLMAVSECGCLVDCTPSDFRTGEPSLTYLTAALGHSWSAVTAAKGALVLAFRKLMNLAREKKAELRFSGAAAAALPTLDIGISALAGADILGMEGILNGTSNYILTRVGEGLPYEDSLREAREKGIAEPDPSFDVGGWDTAGKLLLIANTCLGMEFTMDDIRVLGITALTVEDVKRARKNGGTVKLLGKCEKTDGGRGWNLEVGPSVLDHRHPLFRVDGTEKGITFRTDTMGTVTVTGGRSNPRGAAAALLKDIINIHR